MFFLARFASGPYNHLKNLCAAVNAIESATRILLSGRRLEPKVKFFAQKLSNLGPCEQTDATQAYHREGLGGAKPPAAGRFL